MGRLSRISTASLPRNEAAAEAARERLVGEKTRKLPAGALCATLQRMEDLDTVDPELRDAGRSGW